MCNASAKVMKWARLRQRPKMPVKKFEGRVVDRIRKKTKTKNFFFI
jgi:hypothetical protein